MSRIYFSTVCHSMTIRETVTCEFVVFNTSDKPDKGHVLSHTMTGNINKYIPKLLHHSAGRTVQLDFGLFFGIVFGNFHINSFYLPYVLAVLLDCTVA